MKRALLPLALALALPAQANIWDDAISPRVPDPSTDIYATALRRGDEHVGLANSHSSARSQKAEQVRLAIQAYRTAAAARPKEAEPYFRIGNVLSSFYLENCLNFPQYGVTPSPLRDCTDQSKIDRAIAQQAIDAWSAAEQRAPLDPRFSAAVGDGQDASILFQRAILATRLATRDSLLAAARDYTAILDRSDGRGRLEGVWGNLAETHMMLDRLDDAIDAYREAMRSGGDVSTRYGYAVALDRSERGSLAREVILAQGRQAYQEFRHNVATHQTFFVPTGEVFYYYALVEEAWGNVDEAIGYWRSYISSGAHPQYQPRAKEHLADLMVRARARPTPPRDPIWDMR